MALFAVDLSLNSDLDRRGEVRPEHREYLRSLVDAGKLHESGPYLDNSGALLIYIAESVADVQEILAADPYTKAGLVEGAKIREWNIVISKNA
ncbi:MAG TPA: YciI family protein [Thermomicrobiales bacterium]|nr:YciI family protein [Thermomicrobiales bacterium]